VTGALLVAFAMLLGGCSSQSGTTGGSASTAEPTAAVVATSPAADATKTVVPESPDLLQKRNANILGTMAQMQLSTDQNWGIEPSGDIWPKNKPARLYVHISKLSTAGPSLTYDAMQVYTGARAESQAKRDGQKARNGVYERNSTAYTQELTVNPKAGVLLQNPGAKDAVYGSENYRRITVTTFKDFAEQFTTGERSGELQWGGYWIYFDGSGVQCIIQQPK
jgi:hypothetical protein